MQIDEKHHAFFLAAGDISQSGLPEYLLTQSVDVQHTVCDTCGIDEVRNITLQSTQKAVTGAERSFVVVAHTITVQAQNALLKLFEEPPAGVKFYLLLPDQEVLLPTLRSRLSFLNSGNEQAENEEFATFLSMSLAERLTEIAEKTKAKESQWIKAIVTGSLQQAEHSGDRKFMESVVLVASQINGPGSSKKMLLEELALSLG